MGHTSRSPSLVGLVFVRLGLCEASTHCTIRLTNTATLGGLFLEEGVTMQEPPVACHLGEWACQVLEEYSARQIGSVVFPHISAFNVYDRFTPKWPLDDVTDAGCVKIRRARLAATVGTK
jgi:hypothetical protein